MVTYHGKSNGSAIPFGKHQKLWAVIWGDAVFLLFLACSADLDILCSGSFYHHVKFDSFIFMHKIFTRVVCVNGKHPISPYGHFSLRTVLLVLKIFMRPYLYNTDTSFDVGTSIIWSSL